MPTRRGRSHPWARTTETELNTTDRFLDWIEREIRPLVDRGEYAELVRRTPKDAPITVDGLPNEPIWKLKDRTYLPGDSGDLPRGPAFGFTHDGMTLYLGGSYELRKALDPARTYSARDLSFRVNFIPLLGDHEQAIRVRLSAIGEAGDFEGHAATDCPKYRSFDDFRFASRINSENWSFEFAVPLRELLGNHNTPLFYKITFYDATTSPFALSSFKKRYFFAVVNPS